MDIEEVKRLVELKINDAPEEYEGYEKLKLTIKYFPITSKGGTVIVTEKIHPVTIYALTQFGIEAVIDQICRGIKAYIRELNAGMYQDS